MKKKEKRAVFHIVEWWDSLKKKKDVSYTGISIS